MTKVMSPRRTSRPLAVLLTVALVTGVSAQTKITLDPEQVLGRRTT